MLSLQRVQLSDYVTYFAGKSTTFLNSLHQFYGTLTFRIAVGVTGASTALAHAQNQTLFSKVCCMSPCCKKKKIKLNSLESYWKNSLEKTFSRKFKNYWKSGEIQTQVFSNRIHPCFILLVVVFLLLLGVFCKHWFASQTRVFRPENSL